MPTLGASQVIIMAAGYGSRLGTLTEHCPKAMVEVAGRPLIDYSLDFAHTAGARRRIVVGGYGYELLSDHVDRTTPDATLTRNRDLHAGNLLSMLAGSRKLHDGGFLLMNADHIYPEGVARIVAEVAGTATEITAFCDFDRQLGPDDMKLSLTPERTVREMSKQLASWDGGYVGMTYVPTPRRETYFAAVDAIRTEHGDNIHVEQVLVGLAQQNQNPAIADISGHGWHEVDEPAERDAAEAALKAR